METSRPLDLAFGRISCQRKRESPSSPRWQFDSLPPVSCRKQCHCWSIQFPDHNTSIVLVEDYKLWYFLLTRVCMKEVNGTMASKVSARSEQSLEGVARVPHLPPRSAKSYTSIEEYTNTGKRKNSLLYPTSWPRNYLQMALHSTISMPKAWTCVTPILFEPSASVTSHDNCGVLCGLQSD